MTELGKAIAAVDELLRRCAPSKKTAKKRMHIYVEGVKAKLAQAEYAAARISTLYDRTGTTTGGGPLSSADAEVAFYVDAFFAFLYSSFDVLAQVINQSYGLGLDEHKVSLKLLHPKIVAAHRSLADVVKKVLNASSFKQMERYRHCSTHRRQIYIEERSTTRKAPSGYTMTGPLHVVERLVCDDPYDLNPKIAKSRELRAYNDKMLRAAAKQISQIAKAV